MLNVKDQLDANIPASVITKRSQGGKELSYLETWYVIDRLNQVLGTENWSWQIVKLDPLQSEKMSFICHGVISVDFGNGKYTQKSGIGYGSDKTNYNSGEMASKEAESDAFKRAAMKLGRSLGLALYDKSGEFVDEEVKGISVQATKAGPTAVAKKETPAASKDTEKPQAAADTKIQRQSIKSYFAVLKAKGVVDESAFKTKYLGGKKVDLLTDQEVLSTLTKVKTDFKAELSL